MHIQNTGQQVEGTVHVNKTHLLPSGPRCAYAHKQFEYICEQYYIEVEYIMQSHQFESHWQGSMVENVDDQIHLYQDSAICDKVYCAMCC